MVHNEQLTTTLAAATTRVLEDNGSRILLDPSRFAQMVVDATGNAQTPQVILFSRNCDRDLLDPFVRVVVDKEPKIPALQEAAAKVADILQNDRGVIADLSNEIAGQLMAGIARYAKDAKESPKAKKPKKKEDSEASKKGKNRLVLTIVAIVIGVLILAILVWTLVLPKFRDYVTLYDYQSGKDEHEVLEGWRGGTVVLPDAIAEDEGSGEFVGWSTSTDRTKGEVLAPGTEVNLEDTKSYYAVRNPKITFDGNGATSGSMDPIVVEPGKEFELPECKYAKEGQVFAGWLPSDAENESYVSRPGEKTTVYESATYRAKWTPKPSITEISITELGDKNGAVEGWDPKTGIVAILVKNDTNENVHLDMQTVFQSKDGNKLAEYGDYLVSMAPGEKSLVAWSRPSDREDVATVTYALNASKAYDWAVPLSGNVKHEVMSKDDGKLKIKLTNTGDKEADIAKTNLVAKDKAGNLYIHTGRYISNLKAGESAEITFDETTSVVYAQPAPAWDQVECTFYINGNYSVI